MKKKKSLFNLLVFTIMIHHGLVYVVSPLTEQTILPLESTPIGVALPVIAPIVASQGFSIPGIVGIIVFQFLLAYTNPIGLIPSLPPRNIEKKPNETSRQSKYTITNNTDKPIIYDSGSGKLFQANYSDEGDLIKGKEMEIKATFK